MCCTIILNIFIIIIIGCPILNCMIHYNVYNDKDKYCAILWVEIIVRGWKLLWAGENYCALVDLVITLDHRDIGF